MKNAKKLVVTIAGALLLGGIASAAPGDRQPSPRMLEKFDANRDGQLDDAERQVMKEKFRAKHEKRRQKLLAEFDAIKDGKLDEAERARAHEVKSAERFKKLDTNGDGVLSLQEFQAAKGKFMRHGRK